MDYFHEILLSYHFEQVRPGFYIRATPAIAGGTLYCSTNETDYPRQLLLWQAHRVLLQGEVVTKAALEQVLDRVLAPIATSKKGTSATQA